MAPPSCSEDAAYANGCEIQRDCKIPVFAQLDETVKWLKQASKVGHTEAQYRLGLIYEHALPTAEHNVTEAVSLYEKVVATRAHPQALLRLGMIYARRGQSDAMYRKRAIVLLRRAAELGDAEAQYQLGKCLSRDGGAAGADNMAEAMRWHLAAAKQGHASAQHSIGLASEVGHGTECDMAKAAEWLGLAAKQRLDARQSTLLGLSISMPASLKVDDHGPPPALRKLPRFLLGIETPPSSCVSAVTTPGSAASRERLPNPTVAHQVAPKAPARPGHRRELSDTTEMRQRVNLAKPPAASLPSSWAWPEIQEAVSQAGAPGVIERILLDLKEARKTVREAIRAVREEHAAGLLTADDLKDAMAAIGVSLSAPEARAIVEAFDCTGEGGINLRALEAALRKCPKEASAITKRVKDEDFGPSNELAEQNTIGGIGMAAVEALKKAADQGNAVAQYNLGALHMSGEGVPRDYEKAMAWFHAAAQRGEANAMYELAQMSQCGLGVAIDPVKAAEWLQKAVHKGQHLEAMFQLAWCYETGTGVDVDHKASVLLLKQAARLGHSFANCNLGTLFQMGKQDGLERSIPEAIEHLTLAAEGGDAVAQYNLGLCFASNKGKFYCPEQAVKWYLAAAQQGLVAAQFNLALCYQNGVGTQQLPAMALKWYQQAAAQGDLDALCHLGLCYRDGIGVARNERNALQCLTSAAEANCAPAQYNLAMMLKAGEGKKEPDMPGAVKWLRRAAQNRFVLAEYALGAMFRTGEGLTVDEYEATKWLKRVAEPGIGQYNNRIADESVQNVESDLSSRDGASTKAPKRYMGITEVMDEFPNVNNLLKTINTSTSTKDVLDKALLQLGICYQHGQGVACNPKEAVKYYRQAAMRGSAPAQNRLGICFRDGVGLPQNDVEAEKWFARSAEQHYPDAQFNLASVYEIGTANIAKNLRSAFIWYRKAAVQGLRQAQIKVAECYKHSSGVKMSMKRSMVWYKQAAKHDDADAMYQVGIYYQNGEAGHQSMEKAVEWYLAAANLNHTRAQHVLALHYKHGNGIGGPDAEGAFHWFRAAAEAGLTDAMYQLGQCYLHGTGVEQDMVKAYFWLDKVNPKSRSTA